MSKSQVRTQNPSRDLAPKAFEANQRILRPWKLSGSDSNTSSLPELLCCELMAISKNESRNRWLVQSARIVSIDPYIM